MSDKITALNFNAASVEPAKANEVIPAGWYPCEIIDAEVKPTGKTKANKGLGAYFNFKVLSGDYKGRVIFGTCINVQNASAQCQEIGQRELSAICHAVGIINVSDLAAFIGRTLEVKVKVKRATEEEKEKGWEDKNEPSGYKALAGSGGPAAPAGFVPGAPPVPGMPPAAPAPPVAAPVAPPAVVFPPEGWVAHPSAPGHFYCGQEVLTEADLRARFAPVAAPVAPPVAPPVAAAPPAAPMPPAIPAAAPVADFPPAGWVANPNGPGWYYNPTTGEQKAEADLRAMSAAPVAPAVPAGAPLPPAAPVAGSPPPWKPPGA